MKRAIVFLLSITLMVSCSSPVKKVRPMIDEYLLETISHPETYVPIKTVYLGEARMERDPLAEFPTGDTVDVKVFTHYFSHYGRDDNKRESAYCFYFSDDLLLLRFRHSGDEPVEGLVWKK